MAEFENRIRAKGGSCENCDSILIFVVDRRRLGRLGVFTTWSCTECGHRWEHPGRNHAGGPPDPSASSGEQK